MLRVSAENDQLYRLADADGRTIGWIRDSTIGFCGLDDERLTAMGAALAWRSLDAALRREYSGWPRYEPAIDELHVVHDGAQAWIADATRRLARLLRVDDVPPGLGCLSLEFELPSYVPLRTMLLAAAPMSRALEEARSAGAGAPSVAPLAPAIAP